jgi:hypothetical protein
MLDGIPKEKFRNKGISWEGKGTGGKETLE